MHKKAKRWGSILNLIFLVNWLTFIIIIIYIYKNTYQKAEPFWEWLEIICWVLPFAFLFLLSFYIFIAFTKIKTYPKPEQTLSIKYVAVIVTLAALTILSSLLILLAKTEQNIIIAIILYLSLSFIFAIAALVIDAIFFMKRLKWEVLIINEKPHLLINEDNPK